MMYLYANADKGVRIADLDRYHEMTHQTTIGILKNLEKKGLITYKSNPDDARSRFIVPTAYAYEKQAELTEAGDNLENQLTEKLNKEERKQLVQLLRKLLGVKS